MFIMPSKSKHKTQTTETVGNPIISGSASKEELESVAKRYGWTRTQLSAKDIHEMGSGEARFYEVCRPDVWNAAFQREAISEHNKQCMVGWNAKRMWDGKATEEESQKAYVAGDRFASNYSQFLRSESNAKAIISYMEENNLDATQVQSYVEAFERLAPQGKLVLSPKAAGIGAEETLTGEALRKYPRLHLLLQKSKTVKAEDKLSADQWLQSHPELRDNRISPLTTHRMDVAAATVAHFERSKGGTAEGQAVRFTDMGGKDYSGYPSHPTKHSFRRLLGSLDSVEYARRLNEDPAFARAVDSLNDGNK